jgi:hypothetical protein
MAIRFRVGKRQPSANLGAFRQRRGTLPFFRKTPFDNFKKLAEAARKPGSVPAAGYPEAGDGHSSRSAVAGALKQPTRKHGRAVLNASLFGLAPGGVYLASDVTAGPGELLPHPFTLTRRSGRTSLCGTFPGVTPAGRYPAPCPVEPGLSSPPAGGGHLVCFGQTVQPFYVLRSTFYVLRYRTRSIPTLNVEHRTLNGFCPSSYSSRCITRMRWQCGQVITSSARNSVL